MVRAYLTLQAQMLSRERGSRKLFGVKRNYLPSVVPHFHCSLSLVQNLFLHVVFLDIRLLGFTFRTSNHKAHHCYGTKHCGMESKLAHCEVYWRSTKSIWSRKQLTVATVTGRLPEVPLNTRLAPSHAFEQFLRKNLILGISSNRGFALFAMVTQFTTTLPRDEHNDCFRAVYSKRSWKLNVLSFGRVNGRGENVNIAYGNWRA